MKVPKEKKTVRSGTINAVRPTGRTSKVQFNLGQLIESIRLEENKTLVVFSKRLKISSSHLNDIEKGRKYISPSRAARFAKALGYSEDEFVKLSLQDFLTKQGLKYNIQVK